MMAQFHPILWVYQLIQHVLDLLLSPKPAPPNLHLRRPKIAIIGAGLTGVSAASHCIGHGFDVTIFEADGREHLGGIWSVCPQSLNRLTIHILSCLSARQQNLRPSNPQLNVSFPPLRSME